MDKSPVLVWFRVDLLFAGHRALLRAGGSRVHRGLSKDYPEPIVGHTAARAPEAFGGTKE